MKALERFKSVFKGEPVDRPPICGWIGLPTLANMTNTDGKKPTTEEETPAPTDGAPQKVHVEEEPF